MKLKQISKRALSVVLTLLMVLSTMIVGTIGVNAVGAVSGVIPSGEHLYYDLTACTSATAMNYVYPNSASSWYWDYTSIPSNRILDVTLQYDMNFNEPGNVNVGKSDIDSWAHAWATTVPADGQNCIKVSADGKSYEWTTYGSSSGGETGGETSGDNVVFYVACPSTDWGDDWKNMTVRINGSTTYGPNVTNSTGCSAVSGTKKVMSTTERYVTVITIPKSVVDTCTSFELGNGVSSNLWFNGKSYSGKPQYGYCYYFDSSGGSISKCAATTIANPTVNGAATASIKPGDSVTFNATVTKNNTASGSYTAGGTTYGVQYTLTNTANASDVVVVNQRVVGNGTGRGVINQTYTVPDTMSGTYTVTAQIFDDYTMIDSTGTNAELTVGKEYVAPVFTTTGDETQSVNASTSLTLNAAATCSDGSDVTYLTTCTSSNSADAGITNANTASPVFYSTVPGTYTVVTTATNANDSTKTATKTFTITVNEVTTTYTYYLTGTINGTDYMTSTSTSVGSYNFVDNKVTVELTQISYIHVTAVDENGNKTVYGTDYVSSSSAGTSYPLDSAKNDKINVGLGNYTFTLTVNSDGTLSVSYATAGTYSVNATAGANGTVNVYNGTGIAAGTGYTVQVMPDGGYEVDTFTVDGVDKKSSLTASGNAFNYTDTIGSADVTVNVTFKATGSSSTAEYYYWGADNNNWGSGTKLNQVGDIWYYQLGTSGTEFKIATSSATTDYPTLDTAWVDNTLGDVTITTNAGDYNNWTVNASNAYLIINTSTSKVYASTTLPGAAETFSVTMTMGETGYVEGEDRRADSGFDSTVYTSEHTETYSKEDHLTVAFRTETTHTDTVNGTSYIKYAVQGYSILMKYTDDTLRVRSVTSVNNPSSGVYTATYTFPENVKSAVVTPVFTLTDEYAAAMGITFTTVYLMYTPNTDVAGFRCYEPYYMTWRSNDFVHTIKTSDERVLENYPDSDWPGQPMLYIGNNMYAVKVQSEIQGILFDDNNYDNGGTITQTFDYDEFIRLQKLGYDDITFELRTSNESPITSAIDGAYYSNNYKIYDTPQDISATLTNTVYTDANINQEFAILSDIEGDVIDVFGNKLKDTSGNSIAYKSLGVQADGSEGTTLQKLEDLLIKMGTLSSSQTLADLPSNAASYLFGARYGDGSRTGSVTAPLISNIGYGMQYPVRVYYFDNLKKMSAQMVSGYGNIENSASTTAGKTNIEAGLVDYEYWTTASSDANNKTTAWTATAFSASNTVIPTSYANMPYLVSYSVTNENRVDGKWYYQRGTAQLEVSVETALLDEDGSYTRNSACGTATVNGETTAQVDQGSNPTFQANNNAGYAFVGWYNASGELYDTAATYSGHTVASEETIYAVFKQLEEYTLSVKNYVYQGDGLTPAPGGGSGAVTATLYVSSYDELNCTYGDYVAYTTGSATVRDGDKVYWEITGTATGIDKFTAFREKVVNSTTGDVTYEALDPQTETDGAVLTVAADGKSATYTSEAVVWNWSNVDGQSLTSYTITRYTDFLRVDSYATLIYHYNDRFGNMKTYTVKNVKLDPTRVATGNYTPTTEQIYSNAPYVGDLFKTVKWDVVSTSQSSKNNITDSRAEIYAVETDNTFDTYVLHSSDVTTWSKDANGKFTGITAASLAGATHSNVTYNSDVQLQAASTATIDGTSYNFSYWMQYDLTTDGNGGIAIDYTSGEIFSYSSSISAKVTFPRVFVPVYGADISIFSTSLQNARYSREKSDDGDYVYADFLAQFETSVSGKLFRDVVTESASGGVTTAAGKVTNVRYGLILETDVGKVYDGTNWNDIVPDDTTSSNVMDNIKSVYDTSENGTLSTGLKTDGTWNVTSSQSTDAAYNYYYNVYDYTSSAAQLTNLGRIDYYYRFNNTAANQGKIYNVYSYVIYELTKENGTKTFEVVLSEPRTLSIYATGTNQTPNTEPETTA